MSLSLPSFHFLENVGEKSNIDHYDKISDDWWTILKSCRHSKLILPPNAFKSAGKDKYNLFGGSILSSEVPSNCVPLLCIVNSKSGGNKGKFVIEELKKLLNPVQVIDIFSRNPFEALKIFSSACTFRVLVCGGDGTVGWVLAEIENLPVDIRPAVAIYPLGTGNDLARVMHWGAGVGIIESLSEMLYHIQHARITFLDRWELCVTPQMTSGNKPQPANGKLKRFNNYFGIGVDAQIVLKFHDLRERKPHRFFHQSVNKLWYGVMGWKEIWRRNCSDLRTYLQLKVDGEVIDIPEDTEGIIICNIPSYGGGMNLWGDEPNYEEPQCADDDDVTSRAWWPEEGHDDGNDGGHDGGHGESEHHETPQLSPVRDRDDDAKHASAWKPQSIQDGVLEVVCVNGSLQLARIKIGLDQSQKIAQGHEIEIVTSKSMPLQVDGEPWGENACRLTIKLYSKALMLCRNDIYNANRFRLSSNHYQGGSTEMLLDWATNTNVISSDQKMKLLAELSRRHEEYANDITQVHMVDNTRIAC